MSPASPTGGNAAGILFTNAGDPRFAQMDTKDGKRITFFGLRGADGLPAQVTAYTVAGVAEPDKATTVSLDEKGRYVGIMLPGGEGVRFDYSSKDSARILFVDKAGMVLESRSVAKNPNNPRGGRVLGTKALMGNINIRLAIKNPISEKEEEIGSDADQVKVSVLKNGGNLQTYETFAQYNAAEKIYAVPIPIDVNIDKPQLAGETAKAIKQAVDIMCFDCTFNGVSVGVCKAAPIVLAELCPFLINPAAVAICGGVALAGAAACLTNQVVDLLAVLEDFKREFSSVTDGTVTVTATIQGLGKKTALPVNVSTIKANPNRQRDGYDIKIVFEEGVVMYLLTNGHTKYWVDTEDKCQPAFISFSKNGLLTGCGYESEYQPCYGYTCVSEFWKLSKSDTRLGVDGDEDQATIIILTKTRLVWRTDGVRGDFIFEAR